MFVDIGETIADVELLAQSVTLFDSAVTWNPGNWGSFSGSDALRITFGGAISGNWKLAMLLGIKPGGMIPRHHDNPAAENGLDGAQLERVHVVLATNDGCWNYHDGQWQRLQVGHVYTMDPGREHGSVNWGTSTRWHLIVDRQR